MIFWGQYTVTSCNRKRDPELLLVLSGCYELFSSTSIVRFELMSVHKTRLIIMLP